MPWLLPKGDSLSPQSFLLAPWSTGGMLLASDFPPASQGGEQGLPKSPSSALCEARALYTTSASRTGDGSGTVSVHFLFNYRKLGREGLSYAVRVLYLLSAVPP